MGILHDHKCHNCKQTLSQINKALEDEGRNVGLTKIYRWPGDTGVWQCDPCKEWQEELDQVDL